MKLNDRGIGPLTFMPVPFSLKGGVISVAMPLITFLVDRFSLGEFMFGDLQGHESTVKIFHKF